MVEVTASLKQLLHGDFLRNNVMQIGEEAVFLAGVQFESVEDVGEVEGIDNDSGFVRESSGLDDVHAPGGEGSGNVCEEASAVAGNYGQVEELPVGAQVELDGVVGKVEGHLEMIADLLG